MCVCVCVCVCACVCVCVRACMHLRMPVHMCVCVCMCVCMYTCVCMHVHMCMHVHCACMYTYVCACMHVSVWMCLWLCTPYKVTNTSILYNVCVYVTLRICAGKRTFIIIAWNAAHNNHSWILLVYTIVMAFQGHNRLNAIMECVFSFFLLWIWVSWKVAVYVFNCSIRFWSEIHSFDSLLSLCV